MGKAREQIDLGKAQFAAGKYSEAKRSFKKAKEYLDEVRGTNQQQQGGMGGAMGGGMGGSKGGPMAGGPMMGGGMGSGSMGSGPMMGSGGSGAPMMGGGGMGGGGGTGLIPPEKRDLVVQARIDWMTAVMWWGKSWGQDAMTSLVPQRVVLGSWAQSGGQQQQGMGGMGGGKSGSAMGGSMMGGRGGGGGPMMSGAMAG